MSKKILIVDDNKPLVEILAKQLEARGYVPLAAYDGAQGLTLAKKERPDLVVLDLSMPILDGITVCKIIKGEPGTKHIKIIMLTADHLVGEMEDSFAAGADIYLNKPYDLQQLLAHIKNLIG